MQTIIFDVDEVLLKWNSRLMDFLTSVGLQSEAVAHKIKNDEYIDLQKEIYPEILDEYHQSIFCKDLLPYETKTPTKLNQLAHKYEIVALTSFSDKKEAIHNRVENINKYYGHCFSQIEVLPALAPKKEKLIELSKTKDIKFFVDDTKKHIDEGIEVLGADKVVWFTKKPLEKKDYEITILNNWEDLSEKLM